MKIGIELAMLVRMTKHVVVEVPDDFDVDPDNAANVLSDVYEADEGDGFALDESWGCEEGTHCLIYPLKDPDSEPDYALVDGVVSRVEYRIVPNIHGANNR